MTSQGIKNLKVFHLVFAFMWMGGALVLTIIPLFIIPQDKQEAFIYAKILDFIDVWMIILGLFGSLSTGLAYSIWSKWGFFKHRWLTFKWVVIILQTAFGAFILGPMVTDNVAIASAMTESVSNYPSYFDNLRNISLGGSVQLFFLILFVLISINKPWKINQRVKEKTT